MKRSILRQIIKEVIQEELSDFVLDFPELMQDYDCGATALQGVLMYYGEDLYEKELIDALDEFSEDVMKYGTPVSGMINVAKLLGYKAEVKTGLSIDELIKIIKSGIPAILLIQAWGEGEKPKDWNKGDDGHYVVVIGKQGDKIIFEDPRLPVRGWMTEEELNSRWYGIAEDNGKIVKHVAVLIYGKGDFKLDYVAHIDEIKIDDSLNKYNDVVLFPEKLTKANKVLEKVGVPKVIAYHVAPEFAYDSISENGLNSKLSTFYNPDNEDYIYVFKNYAEAFNYKYYMEHYDKYEPFNIWDVDITGLNLIKDYDLVIGNEDDVSDSAYKIKGPVERSRLKLKE